MARIFVGTSGWTDASLVKCGRFYPADVHTPEARLKHYASRFSMAEVDATYYAPPTRRNSALWAQRTPPGFVFNIKAYSMLTGHPTKVEGFYPELLARLPPWIQSKHKLHASDIPEAILDEVAWRFVDGLQPLRAAGKLGWVLMQFPPWFAATRENARQVIVAARRLGGLRLAIEFRHASWAADDTLAKTVMFLHKHELAMVCVDAPQGFVSSMPPWSLVTDPKLAVLRLHGRNKDTWQAKNKTAAERFHYRYSYAELAELEERVQLMNNEAEEVHVVMSNCHEDDAVLNAAEMAAMLGVAGPHPQRLSEDNGEGGKRGAPRGAEGGVRSSEGETLSLPFTT